MKPEHHAKARNLFFQTDLTQAQVASLIGISEKTLSLWAREGSWRRLKRLAKETPAVMIDQLYSELTLINEAIKAREPGKQFATTDEAEVRRKTLAAIKYVQVQQSAANHAEVLMNFTTYVLARNLDHAKILTEYADKFLKGEKQIMDTVKYKPYGLTDMLEDGEETTTENDPVQPQ